MDQFTNQVLLIPPCVHTFDEFFVLLLTASEHPATASLQVHSGDESKKKFMLIQIIINNARGRGEGDNVQLQELGQYTAKTQISRGVRGIQPKKTFYEAMLGVLGIRDSLQNNFRDKG